MFIGKDAKLYDMATFMYIFLKIGRNQFGQNRSKEIKTKLFKNNLDKIDKMKF